MLFGKGEVKNFPLWRGYLLRRRQKHQREAVALLKDARALIVDPKHWCKGRYHSEDGERFCAVGALMSAGRGFWHQARGLALEALETAAYGLGYYTVEGMNDVEPHGIVLSVFDTAIGIAEKASIT